MKKFLVVFSLIMIFTLAMSSSFALSKFSDTIGTKYDTAVELLTNRKIVDGFEDGTFRPQSDVTRAQLCKLIVVSLKLENVTNVVLTKFPDVNSSQWFYSYVKTAVDNNIIVGYPDGEFKPNNKVTFAEAMTMILRAMGQEKTMTDKTWPTAYMNEASALGLLKNVEYADVNAAAPRGEIAMGLYNMVVKIENDKAVAEQEKKAADEKAKKDAAENTPEEFDIVDSVSEGKDDDYYVKLKGLKTKQEVISLLGSKTYKYSKLEEYEERVVGYDEAKNDNEIEIKMSFEAKDLDSAKVVSTVESDKITYKDKTTLDVAKAKSDYKYYTFLKITCDVDEDDGEITFTKVTNEGKGFDSVKLVKADRILINSDKCVFAIFKDIGLNDTIKKGKVTESSSDASVDDYYFGIAGATTTSNKTTYVKIDSKKYEVKSKSKSFTEDALVCYTKDDGEVTLVRNIPTTLLDAGSGIDMVSSASGSKGDQTVKFDGSTSTIDTSSTKTYKNYAVVLVEVSENKSGKVVIDDYDVEESIADIKFAKGDRVLIDKSNEIFVVFTGLSASDTYKNGTNTTKTTQYTVSYAWASGYSALSGVTLPSSTKVDAGTKYTVKTFTKSGYTITTSKTGSITINSNTTITVSYKANTTTKYTVSYKWATGAGPEGASLPASEQVESDTMYTVKLPSKVGYIFTSSEGSSFKVTGNTEVKISWEEDTSSQEAQIAAARAALETAKQELKDAQDKQKSLDEEVTRLKGIMDEAKIEKESKESAYDDAVVAVSKAKDKKDKADKEVADIMKQIEEAESGDDISSLERQLETARDNQSKAGVDLTTANKEKDDAQEERDTAIKAYNKAEEAYIEKKTEADDQKITVAAAQKRVDDAQAKLDELLGN